MRVAVDFGRWKDGCFIEVKRVKITQQGMLRFPRPWPIYA